MRKLIIMRRSSGLNTLQDVSIIVNTKFLGVLKKEEEKFEIMLSPSQQVIQVEYTSEGIRYRSNAFFALYGKEPITLYFSMSGTRMVLEKI